jgi:hypothetical protein
VSLDLLTRISRAGADTTARLAQPGGPAVAARRALGAAGLLCVVAGVLLLNPTLVLCGLVITTTGLLMRWLAWDLALPAAVIGLLVLSTLVAVAGGLLGLDLLVSPWIVASIYVVYGGAAAYWVWRPSVQLITSPPPTGGFAWVTYSAAAIAAAIGLAQSFFERMSASWAFEGTDLAQHMILVQQVQRSGSLDYSVFGYPRAFHMLMAFVSVPGPPLDNPLALLSYDMRLVAAATWLALALVLWTGVTLVLRLGAARGAPQSVAVGAAALFGAGALLTNTFVVTFVYMGAAASLLAVAVIFASPLAVLGLDARRRRVVVLPVWAATSVMLLAHLWQPLIMVPPLMLVAYAAPGLRDVLARATWRRPKENLRRPLALVLAASLVTLAVASVPILSIQSAGGVALAATSGQLPDIPWPVVLLGLAVAAFMIRDLRRGSTRVYLGSVSGVLLTVAVMLQGANHGFDLHQYYPMKVLWILTILLGPILALAAVDLGWRLLRPVWRRLGGFGPFARISRFALAASLCAVAFAFCLPPLLGNGSTSWASLARQAPSHGPTDISSSGAVSAERFDIAAAYGMRYGHASTVPVAVGLSTGWDHYGPNIVSKLISFQTTQLETAGQVADVCSEVAAVALGSGSAVVITQMDPDVLRAVMKQNGCGDVRVVKIPWGQEPAP